MAAFISTYPAAYIDSEIGRVGSAVVDILNDGTLDLPQPAIREYLPAVELQTAGDTSVLVAVTDRTLERISRRGFQEHVAGVMPSMAGVARRVLVEVGINKKFDEYDDLQAADPIMTLCEDTANLLNNVWFTVDTTWKAYPVNDGTTDAVTHKPLYDPGLWKTNQQFTGIIRVTYRLTSEGGL